MMDREHAGGEIQRLGGIVTMQAPGDELVAVGGAGLGRIGSGKTKRRTGRVASSRCVAGTGSPSRLIAKLAHQLASARIFLDPNRS